MTIPSRPSTMSRSPLCTWPKRPVRPETAGMPSPRASTAAWPVLPPASVAMPLTGSLSNMAACDGARLDGPVELGGEGVARPVEACPRVGRGGRVEQVRAVPGQGRVEPEGAGHGDAGGNGHATEHVG